jgi:hypothetical protein
MIRQMPHFWWGLYGNTVEWKYNLVSDVVIRVQNKEPKLYALCINFVTQILLIFNLFLD